MYSQKHFDYKSSNLKSTHTIKHNFSRPNVYFDFLPKTQSNITLRICLDQDILNNFI